MENTDNISKQQAVDGQGAFAGNAESTPEQVTVDAVASKAGIELEPGQATDIKRILDERDEKRWELDPDSTKSQHPSS